MLSLYGILDPAISRSMQGDMQDRGFDRVGAMRLRNVGMIVSFHGPDKISLKVNIFYSIFQQIPSKLIVNLC